MATGLGSCPDTMNVAISLFQPANTRYIPWKPSEGDGVWEQCYLSQQLHTVQASINNIHDASTSSVNDICTYVALTFTTLNSIILALLLRKFCSFSSFCSLVQGPPATVHETQQEEDRDPCQVCQLPLSSGDSWTIRPCLLLYYFIYYVYLATCLSAIFLLLACTPLPKRKRKKTKYYNKKSNNSVILYLYINLAYICVSFCLFFVLDLIFCGTLKVELSRRGEYMWQYISWLSYILF